MKHKRIPIIVLSVVVLLFGALWGFNVYRDQMVASFYQHFVPPPVVVATSPVRRLLWRHTLLAVGNLEAVQTVTLSPELAGKVTGIFFHSGQFVRRGTRLLQLDDAEERATLQALRATAVLDRIQFQRQKELLAQNLAARSAYDLAHAAYRTARAQAQSEAAVVAKMSIQAPFSGFLGIRLVNLGQYLTAGTAVVSLTRLTPLYVSFRLPEQDFPDLHLGQEIALEVPAYPGHRFTGRLKAIAPTVNPTTRLIHALAIVPNRKQRLRPGMFGRVRVLSRRHYRVLAIPRIALSYSLYGDTVWVVSPPKTATDPGKPGLMPLPTVREVFVKPGSSHGSWVSIDTGLKPGMVVVTQGQVKLHAGARIRVNNAIPLITGNPGRPHP
ncbi:MAG: efflux RND transporter periplasmic adaptor subunit [Gammaproteobacteria bacterium]